MEDAGADEFGGKEEIGCEGFLSPIGGFTPDAADHGAIGRSGDLEHPAPRTHRKIEKPLGPVGA